MYDEVMQLIALAKNDEKYFQRIEELKQKQLEVAQVLEIAKTLGEADKHLALARQKASDILDEAAIEAKKLKEKESTEEPNRRDTVSCKVLMRACFAWTMAACWIPTSRCICCL